MIEFAAPATGGLALAALLVPLVIHRVRRRLRGAIPFAALDWLAARMPPRRQWQLDERLLLATRLLLVALLAALLAEPQWRASGEPPRTVVLVLPGIAPEAAHAAVDAPLADWRWLAVGNPPLDAPLTALPTGPAASPTSLIRALDAELPPAVRLVVVLPEQLSGLDGERLQLGRAVDWRVLPGGPSPPPETAAVRPFPIAIRAEAAAAVLARALVAAWRADGVALAVDDAPPGTPLPAGQALLITGASPDAALRAQAADGLTVLYGDAAADGEVLLRDDAGAPLLRCQSARRGRLCALAGPLDAGAWPALRDPQRPRQLRALLGPSPAVPDRAPAVAVAPLKAAQPSRGAATPLAPWLAVAIAAVALLERALAARRRQPAE